ncbi:MAG: phospholipase D-like domain-containing protein [Sphingomonas fennica]
MDDPAPLPDDARWRCERAARLSVIIDADDYFAAARQAMLTATRSILLIGWDFDARVDLGSSAEAPDAPRQVGEFILWLADRTPTLTVNLLRWDIGAIKSLFRGNTMLTVLRWMRHKRITTKLDGHHPASASHHQKIVIVDDRIAFCGGIDMTGDRWDTRAHADHEPRRKRPGGQPYKPWHDAICALEGPAAVALGELFRERWQAAGGGPIAPRATDGTAQWPALLGEPHFTDVPVCISRTRPRLPDQEEVREIERMTVALIAAARRTLYIESQYFASRRVAEALARRLAEADPPEIVIINPLTAQGWLEPIAMDTARARLMEALRRIDTHGRLRLYHPYTAGGEPIYCHAKILIADDRVIRVGSSNLNNRSMGLDTECDLTLDSAACDDPAVAARILAIRDDLLAEHLGTSPETVTARIAAEGSMIGAIEALRGPGRSLRPYELEDVSAVTAWLADNEVLDPEGPDEMFEALDERRLTRRLRRLAGRVRGR